MRKKDNLIKCITKLILFFVIIVQISTHSIATNIENDSINSVAEITTQENSNNTSLVVIEDDANLLTEYQEEELRKEMNVLTEYGIVLFKTTDFSIDTRPLKYIQSYFYSKFGNKAGVAFYIDMSSRELCVTATSAGGLDKIITSAKCNIITDNIYRYASSGNYYKCASEAYKQMNQLLSGGKIAETMKHVCNAILSIMLSLFFTYGVFLIIMGNKKATHKEIVGECEVKFKHGSVEVIKKGSHRVYSPRSTSSSGGGGSSGHSSGGGFSGSGGSHRF